MKKILHFSNQDKGGAYTAAYRFHKNLELYGLKSYFLVSKKSTNDESVLEIPTNIFYQFVAKVLGRLEDSFDLYDKKYYFLDRNRSPYRKFDNLITK